MRRLEPRTGGGVGRDEDGYPNVRASPNSETSLDLKLVG